MKKILLIFLVILSFEKIYCQNLLDWRVRIPLSDSGYVDILQYIQVWNTVTLKSPETNPRFDQYIRRGRLGFGGQLNSKALFYVGFAYDGIGKDKLTASAGVPNALDNFTFFVRDAFFTYRFNSFLNLSIGYFRPRAGKESIYTSAFNISQEKGQPSAQPRIHMVGRGTGRETGINVGGLTNGERHRFLYDFGVFDPNHPLITGDGKTWSPLFTGRLVWMIGDPEMNKYTMVYSQTGYLQRKGISFGANATYQGKTNIFNRNSVFGMDFQLNYGPLDLLGEYLWLGRESLMDSSIIKTMDNSYVLKAAWNVALRKAQILQFSLMYTGTIPDEQFKSEASNPITLASLHKEVAGGVNWMINKNRLKLGLHYVEADKYTNTTGNNIGRYSYLNLSIQWMM
jgi:hypothetical protein